MSRGAACLVGGLMLTAACAGTHPSGTTTGPQLEIELGRSDGTRVQIGALLQKPALLLLFATYDTASQLALTELLGFIATEPRVGVIAVALQPDARSFLDLYRRSLAIPFELFYDPDNAVLQGHSALGKLKIVPSIVALDGDGHVREQALGPPTPATLRKLADSALAP